MIGWPTVLIWPALFGNLSWNEYNMMKYKWIQISKSWGVNDPIEADSSEGRHSLQRRPRRQTKVSAMFLDNGTAALLRWQRSKFIEECPISLRVLSYLHILPTKVLFSFLAGDRMRRNEMTGVPPQAESQLSGMWSCQIRIDAKETVGIVQNSSCSK